MSGATSTFNRWVGTIRRRAKYKLNQHLRLVYLIEIKSAAIPNFKYSSRGPGRKPRSTCFGFRGCRLSDQKSKITQQKSQTRSLGP